MITITEYAEALAIIEKAEEAKKLIDNIKPFGEWSRLSYKIVKGSKAVFVVDGVGYFDKSQVVHSPRPVYRSCRDPHNSTSYTQTTHYSSMGDFVNNYKGDDYFSDYQYAKSKIEKAENDSWYSSRGYVYDNGWKDPRDPLSDWADSYNSDY